MRMKNSSSQLFDVHVTLRSYFLFLLNFYSYTLKWRGLWIYKLSKLKRCAFSFILFFSALTLFFAIFITSFIFHILLVWCAVSLKVYILIFILLVSGTISFPDAIYIRSFTYLLFHSFFLKCLNYVYPFGWRIGRAHMWRSDDYQQEPILFFYHVLPGQNSASQA